MSQRDAVILQASGIVKRFAGVIALDGVSFDLHEGEIHGICGENGAGKSTLIKVLSGIHKHGSYDGTIRIRGEEMCFDSVRDAEIQGIGVIYQELALVGEMTVGENIFLGREPTRFGLIDWLKVADESRKLLAKFNISIDPETPVKQLGVGHQQLVEIARALGRQSRILILDEPTAALSEHEVTALLDILRDLRSHGVTCVYISHKLDEVFAIADRITVLRDGKSVTTLDRADTSRAEVIRHMVGREIGDLYPRRRPAVGNIRLSVRDLSAARESDGETVLSGITFDVREGEVLGIGGLMGAGRTELLMHIFGAWGRRLGGLVFLDGNAMDDVTPSRAIAQGLVLVSEDRKRHGLILGQTVGFNLSLSSLARVTSGGLVNEQREFARNSEMFAALQIKAPSMESRVGQLSGGNQQKVVIGKALLTEPRVVFLDEPTRGIDVGAKVEVYELINQLTDRGMAVVLVSSELPELMGMSDRILMLHEGAVGGAFTRDEATPERLLAAAMGQ